MSATVAKRITILCAVFDPGKMEKKPIGWPIKTSRVRRNGSIARISTWRMDNVRRMDSKDH